MRFKNTACMRHLRLSSMRLSKQRNHSSSPSLSAEGDPTEPVLDDEDDAAVWCVFLLQRPVSSPMAV